LVDYFNEKEPRLLGSAQQKNHQRQKRLGTAENQKEGALCPAHIIKLRLKAKGCNLPHRGLLVSCKSSRIFTLQLRRKVTKHEMKLSIFLLVAYSNTILYGREVPHTYIHNMLCASPSVIELCCHNNS
jgi:hypothetical protein